MSLMAIILWALNALSPLRRLQEHARHLLETLLRTLEDPAVTDWLCANPDNPDSVPRIERMLDDLNASIDLIIYQKARDHLGLRPSWPRPKRSPPQRRRTQTFAELFAKLEACTLRFADIDRLALRRAEKLKHLLKAHPLTTQAAASHPLRARARAAATTTIVESFDKTPIAQPAKPGDVSPRARAPPHPSDCRPLKAYCLGSPSFRGRTHMPKPRPSPSSSRGTSHGRPCRPRRWPRPAP